MIRKQYYGIKFPFTVNNEDRFFIDINENIEEKLGSEILHVILTQKGTRIRRPDFGTNLVKYIYEQNDNLTWESVENEIKNAVSKSIPSIRIKSISVTQEEDNNMYLDISFTYNTGLSENISRLAVKI